MADYHDFIQPDTGVFCGVWHYYGAAFEWACDGFFRRTIPWYGHHRGSPCESGIKEKISHPVMIDMEEIREGKEILHAG